jgi:hypothetical protein
MPLFVEWPFFAGEACALVALAILTAHESGHARRTARRRVMANLVARFNRCEPRATCRAVT